MRNSCLLLKHRSGTSQKHGRSSNRRAPGKRREERAFGLATFEQLRRAQEETQRQRERGCLRPLHLAGFGAEDSTWKEVDKEWRRILGDTSMRPRAEYLHMREAASLEGEFNFRKGWNQKKVNSLVMDLLM